MIKGLSSTIAVGIVAMGLSTGHAAVVEVDFSNVDGIDLTGAIVPYGTYLPETLVLETSGQPGAPVLFVDAPSNLPTAAPWSLVTAFPSISRNPGQLTLMWEAGYSDTSGAGNWIVELLLDWAPLSDLFSQPEAGVMADITVNAFYEFTENGASEAFITEAGQLAKATLIEADPTVIPVPATLPLLLTGIAALAWRRRTT
ncbi:MAG: PEP-CTERM sorting domain-containing protein [Pseudomonadota bacterium]